MDGGIVRLKVVQVSSHFKTSRKVKLLVRLQFPVMLKLPGKLRLQGKFQLLGKTQFLQLLGVKCPKRVIRFFSAQTHHSFLELN